MYVENYDVDGWFKELREQRLKSPNLDYAINIYGTKSLWTRGAGFLNTGVGNAGGSRSLLESQSRLDYCRVLWISSFRVTEFLNSPK
jgi:hypothetical protein